MQSHLLTCIMGVSLISLQLVSGQIPEMRSMRFEAESPEAARDWQKQARNKLFELMMGGKKPELLPLNAEILKTESVPEKGYSLQELKLKSLPDREVHIWMAIPDQIPEGGLPGMLTLHGHGGTGEMIVRGEGLYWYGKALAEQGYVIATLDIGQHELQHEDWSLMGERTWDALVCLEYLCSRPEVDSSRIGTAGLSLGGETVMYVAALDERIKVAISSGWLTTIDNMKNRHCPCWNFPGLEEHFAFSDIFSCVAPRYLMAQIGRQEKAPGGFPLEIAQGAFKEIQKAYAVFDAEDKCMLYAHDEGHVFKGESAFELIEKVLK